MLLHETIAPEQKAKANFPCLHLPHTHTSSNLVSQATMPLQPDMTAATALLTVSLSPSTWQASYVAITATAVTSANTALAGASVSQSNSDSGGNRIFNVTLRSLPTTAQAVRLTVTFSIPLLKTAKLRQVIAYGYRPASLLAPSPALQKSSVPSSLPRLWPLPAFAVGQPTGLLIPSFAVDSPAACVDACLKLANWSCSVAYYDAGMCSLAHNLTLSFNGADPPSSAHSAPLRHIAFSEEAVQPVVENKVKLADPQQAQPWWLSLASPLAHVLPASLGIDWLSTTLPQIQLPLAGILPDALAGNKSCLDHQWVQARLCVNVTDLWQAGLASSISCGLDFEPLPASLLPTLSSSHMFSQRGWPSTTLLSSSKVLQWSSAARRAITNHGAVPFVLLEMRDDATNSTYTRRGCAVHMAALALQKVDTAKAVPVFDSFAPQLRRRLLPATAPIIGDSNGNIVQYCEAGPQAVPTNGGNVLWYSFVPDMPAGAQVNRAVLRLPVISSSASTITVKVSLTSGLLDGVLQLLFSTTAALLNLVASVPLLGNIVEVNVLDLVRPLLADVSQYAYGQAVAMGISFDTSGVQACSSSWAELLLEATFVNSGSCASFAQPVSTLEAGAALLSIASCTSGDRLCSPVDELSSNVLFQTPLNLLGWTEPLLSPLLKVEGSPADASSDISTCDDYQTQTSCSADQRCAWSACVPRNFSALDLQCQLASVLECQRLTNCTWTADLGCLSTTSAQLCSADGCDPLQCQQQGKQQRDWFGREKATMKRKARLAAFIVRPLKTHPVSILFFLFNLNSRLLR